MDEDHHPDQDHEPENALKKYHTIYILAGTASTVSRPASTPAIARAVARDSLSISRISATVRGCRFGTRLRVSSTTAAMPGNGISHFKKASTATSSAAFRVQVAEPPASWH